MSGDPEVGWWASMSAWETTDTGVVITVRRGSDGKVREVTVQDDHYDFSRPVFTLRKNGRWVEKGKPLTDWFAGAWFAPAGDKGIAEARARRSVYQP